jgi:hypothetical protein
VTTWFAAYAFTHAVEIPIYLTLLGTPWRKRASAAVGTSALTHPYVWFVLPSVLMGRFGYYGYVAIAETLVVLVETAVCVCLGVEAKRAFLAALVANAASAAGGFLFLQ